MRRDKASNMFEIGESKSIGEDKRISHGDSSSIFFFLFKNLLNEKLDI